MGLVLFIGFGLLGNNLINYNTEIDSDLYADMGEFTKDLNDTLEATGETREASEFGEVSDEDTDVSLYKREIPVTLDVFQGARLASATIQKAVIKTGLVSPMVVASFIAILTVMVIAFALYMFMRFKPPQD